MAEISPESVPSDLYLTTDEVRAMFLDFFMRKGYAHHPNVGVIPENDPTLLFINSGMAPMKPFFTGEATPPTDQLTNVQDCIRTGDLDDVGDSYHGTSFHMMGSWQFGDRFNKEQAIEYAYELITDGFGLDPDYLLASVLNDEAKEQGIPKDEEAAQAWAKLLPNERIIWLPPSDNLWGPPGTSGPSGPCTEVFFDRGSGFEEGYDNVALRKGRHIEIWNAGVFMTHHVAEDGTVTPLASKSVDGGAGLERIAMILQNAPSIHEIDKWLPAYDVIRTDNQDTRSARIVIDHIRTAEILARSGVIPGNKAGPYVLRTLLRRAMTTLVQTGIEQGRLLEYRDAICEQMDEVPGTVRTHNEVSTIFAKERDAFAKILQRSERLLAPIVARGETTGNELYKLHETHGIPVDILRETCNSNNIQFPEETFAAARSKHAEESSATK